MGDTAINIIVMALLLIVLALNFYMKMRRSMKAPLGRVSLILADINRNEKMVENFGFHRNVGHMKISNWNKNQNKIDFVPLEIRQSLSQLFDMVEDVNGRIDAARKFKSDSYMSGIDVSKLKAPLAKNREQLTAWIQENMDNPDYQPKKRRGLLG